MTTKIAKPSTANTVLPVLTIGDVAGRLRVSTRSVARLISQGKLESFHVGRSVRVTEAALQDFVTRAARL